VGAWRATADGVPLNTADLLADGSNIKDVTTLRAALLTRPSVFVQTLTEKLMVYGLGRGLTYEDGPIVRRIVRAAGARGNRFSAIVTGIVTSEAFQMRMTVKDGAIAENTASRPLRR
jgi:hypothetical protein